MFGVFCTVFKYPSPDAKASPSPTWGEGSGLPRPWCDKILGTDCASRPSMTGARGANSFGRSMIEMLGVLAIIGVLSVGGIAGYSKAMEKWKINKVISEYTYFMFNAVAHADDLKKISKGSGYANTAQSLNMFPETWTLVNNALVNDSFNHPIHMFKIENEELAFEIYLLHDGATENYRQISFCREIFSNFAQPLANFVTTVYVWRNKAINILFYGDNYCGGDRKCLRDVTLDEINAKCRTCSDSKSGGCSIVITY